MYSFAADSFFLSGSCVSPFFMHISYDQQRKVFQCAFSLLHLESFAPACTFVLTNFGPLNLERCLVFVRVIEISLTPYTCTYTSFFPFSMKIATSCAFVDELSSECWTTAYLLLFRCWAIPFVWCLECLCIPFIAWLPQGNISLVFHFSCDYWKWCRLADELPSLAIPKSL